jgi:hypothetical protein
MGRSAGRGKSGQEFAGRGNIRMEFARQRGGLAWRGKLLLHIVTILQNCHQNQHRINKLLLWNLWITVDQSKCKKVFPVDLPCPANSVNPMYLMVAFYLKVSLIVQSCFVMVLLQLVEL